MVVVGSGVRVVVVVGSGVRVVVVVGFGSEADSTGLGARFATEDVAGAIDADCLRGLQRFTLERFEGSAKGTSRGTGAAARASAR